MWQITVVPPVVVTVLVHVCGDYVAVAGFSFLIPLAFFNSLYLSPVKPDNNCVFPLLLPAASPDADADPVGDHSMLPDITMSEIAVE